MRFFDWLFGRQVAEQTAPPPKKDPEVPNLDTPQSEPVGFGGETLPLAQADRKNPAAVISAALRTAQERGRQARYADFEAMDNSDTALMLDAVVDAVLTFDDVTTGRGFKLEADDKATEELIRLAAKTADLPQLAEEALRDMLKYGDCFGEPIFVSKQLVNVQTYRPAEIFVAKDDKGRLAKGKDDNGNFAAFQQKKGGQIVAGWQPWEMIHGKFWPSRKLNYSLKGLLDDRRVDWRKLQLVELGMVVARVTRAYPRRVHTVDMTNRDRGDQERTLRNYINRMTGRVFGKRVTNDDGLPTADVNEDLYVAQGYVTGPDGKLYPKLNTVKTEDPAIAGLAELGDVEYLRQKVWSAVPADVVGIKRSTSSGEVDSQDLAYARMLRRCQVQLEKFLRGILDQVLLASGKLPSATPYRVIFPAVSVGAAWKFADARFRDSLTIRNYLEMGTISRRFAVKRSFNLSDLEVDAMWEAIGEEAENPIFQLQIAPARNGQPGDGASSPLGQVAGAINKASPDGGGAAPTAKTVPATGAKAGASTTNTGISRGTKIGKRLAGSNSGG